VSKLLVSEVVAEVLVEEVLAVVGMYFVFI
jgi:hypothetical protein